MVPSAFVVLDALPLSPNGKIDRKALPGAGAARPELEEAYVAPRTPVEQSLAAVGRGAGCGAGGRAGQLLRAGRPLPARHPGHLPGAQGASGGAAPAGPLRGADRGRPGRAGRGSGAPPWACPPPRCGPSRATGSCPCPSGRRRSGSSTSSSRAARSSTSTSPSACAGRSTWQRRAGPQRGAAAPRGPADHLRPAGRAGPSPSSPPRPRWTCRSSTSPACPRPSAKAEARRLADEESRRPFDLARGPLFRVGLLRLGPEDHVGLLTVHHSVFDGWSLGVFLREVGLLYGMIDPLNGYLTHETSTPGRIC